MAFIKENWIKLTFAAIFLCAWILSLILFIDKACVLGGVNGLPEIAKTDLAVSGATSQMIGGLALMVIFMMLTAVMILKMFERTKGLVSLVLIGAGVIFIILTIIQLVIGADNLKALGDAVNAAKDAPLIAYGGMQEVKDAAVANAVLAYHNQLLGNIINLLLFGALPIIFGIKRMCHRKENR